MNKRDFLKTSSTMVAGSLLSRYLAAEQASSPRTNWAGNLTYSTDHLELASSVEDVRRSVQAHTHLKALGARHSFNNIADSTQAQISLKHFDLIQLDEQAHTVTVGAGVTYGQLAPVIDARGFALHNLASLPHISVVGACATGTHGSGSNNGNLSTAVRSFQIVTADGELKTFSRAALGDKFPGAVINLGALGVITTITLAVEPTFLMDQLVYRDLSFSQLEHHLDDIFSSAYSVSIFTDWQNHGAAEVWLKRKLTSGKPQPIPPMFYGATPATRDMHPIPEHSAENCTPQMAVPGPWYERMPHFRMNFTPSSGAEIQSEYFVPRDKGYQAILAVEQLRDQITPHLFVTELRTIAADDLWISPCYQRPSMTLHFTWKPDAAAVNDILPLIEAKLAPFQPRPHWAKVFTMPPAQVRANYPRMPDYLALLAHYDSSRKFRNGYLEKNFYSG